MVNIIDERSLDIVQVSELKVGEYFIYDNELYIVTNNSNIKTLEAKLNSDNYNKSDRISCVLLEDGKIYDIKKDVKVSKVDVSITIHSLGVLNNDK